MQVLNIVVLVSLVCRAGVVFVNTHSLLLCFHFKVFVLSFGNDMYSLCLFVVMFFPTTFALHTLLNELFL
jgi:hypothetical protein